MTRTRGTDFAGDEAPRVRPLGLEPVAAGPAVQSHVAVAEHLAERSHTRMPNLLCLPLTLLGMPRPPLPRKDAASSAKLWQGVGKSEEVKPRSGGGQTHT